MSDHSCKRWPADHKKSVRLPGRTKKVMSDIQNIAQRVMDAHKGMGQPAGRRHDSGRRLRFRNRSMGEVETLKEAIYAQSHAPRFCGKRTATSYTRI